MNTEAAAQLIQILEKTVSPGKRRSRSTPNGGMGEMSKLKNDGKRVCFGLKQAYTVLRMIAHASIPSLYFELASRSDRVDNRTDLPRTGGADKFGE